MKTTFLLIVLPLSIAVSGLAQQVTSSPKVPNSSPCLARPTPKRTKRTIATPVAPVLPEPAEFFVGEALVEVTKDQTVVRLAMAQHASVLIELPADDGPRYIIPGDPEMVTVDEKALERNKRAIIVRPGSLFVASRHNKTRSPAATVTAQMRSGLVVTFLFYPVANLAQNVHRCVLSYQRDEVVARRRAAGLPVNLEHKEQGGEKPTGQSGAPASITVDPTTGDKQRSGDSSAAPNIIPQAEDQPRSRVDLHVLQPSTSLEAETRSAAQRVRDATKKQLSRAAAKPSMFTDWTKPLHGLALALQDSHLTEEFSVLLLAVRNTGTRPLKLMPGTPELTLEMHDDKGKVINVQSIKPLHIQSSDTGTELGAGGTVYFAIAYRAPLMSVHNRLKLVVAQTNAADEPASIALVK